jgi:hypothetical protein
MKNMKTEKNVLNDDSTFLTRSNYSNQVGEYGLMCIVKVRFFLFFVSSNTYSGTI